MYGYTMNPQMNVERIDKQIKELEDMKKHYQNMPMQQPVNNIINTSQPQTSKNNLVEWRILNENEEVDNLYVNNKTLFINDKNMVLKDVDGKLEKWNIKKIYPIDEKDKKIEELEKQINELKEVIANGYSKHNEPIENGNESTKDVAINDDTTTKASVRSTKK